MNYIVLSECEIGNVCEAVLKVYQVPQENIIHVTITLAL